MAESYLVLARKFRPQTFSEISGQAHVTRTLCNSLNRNRIAHAYLFTGPRGVGKTSIARIFAKALNCVQGPTVSPCLQCANCREIAAGVSLSVREIDGASHNSVDNVRDLIDSFRSLPNPGSKYRIYIIDEVHMLSVAAFNALLKSLEEPPSYAIFILATTEVHKIPDTVLSRCQRHDLRALATAEIFNKLRDIAEHEGVTCEDAALQLITRLADGSLRDAQSLFDRVLAFCEKHVSVDEASQVLGAASPLLLTELGSAIFRRDALSAFEQVQRVFSSGADLALFLSDFVRFFRDVLLLRAVGVAAAGDVGRSPEEASALLALASSRSLLDLQDICDVARQGADACLRSSFIRQGFESLVVRLALREPCEDFGALVAGIKGVLGSAGAGGSMPATRRATPAAPDSRHDAGNSTAASSPSLQMESSSAAGAAPKPVRVSEPQAPQPQQVGPGPLVAATSSSDGLVFLDFVTFLQGAAGATLIREQLSRLRVQEFSRGRLRAEGPEFSVSYLNRADARGKLEEFLTRWSNEKNWRLEFKVVAENAAAAAGSLREQSQQKVIQDKRTRDQEISNHPTLQSLRKVFPGSTIESIKAKDE